MIDEYSTARGVAVESSIKKGRTLNNNELKKIVMDYNGIIAGTENYTKSVLSKAKPNCNPNLTS